MNRPELNNCRGDGGSGKTSRRQWLLKLGEATFLFGFSGFPAEVRATAGAALSLLKPDVKALPPGLYEPSSEHMAHALTADDRYVKIPPGSETDYARPRRQPSHPRFLTSDEFRMVQRLIELTLGTPPSKTLQAGPAEFTETIADIAEWVDLVLSQAAGVREAATQLNAEHRALAVGYRGREEIEKLETAEPERIFRTGLEHLDARSKELHGSSFADVSKNLQMRLLEQPGDEKLLQSSDYFKFLEYLRTQSIRGYYTSRLGLKELGYKGNYFYVECPGCKPQKT